MTGWVGIYRLYVNPCNPIISLLQFLLNYSCMQFPSVLAVLFGYLTHILVCSYISHCVDREICVFFISPDGWINSGKMISNFVHAIFTYNYDCIFKVYSLACFFFGINFACCNCVYILWPVPVRYLGSKFSITSPINNEWNCPNWKTVHVHFRNPAGEGLNLLQINLWRKEEYVTMDPCLGSKM